MKASLTWGYLCFAPGPFSLRGHLVYILSFRDISIKYAMNIQAKKGILQSQKKTLKILEKKKCCKLLLCSKT